MDGSVWTAYPEESIECLDGVAMRRGTTRQFSKAKRYDDINGCFPTSRVIIGLDPAGLDIESVSAQHGNHPTAPVSGYTRALPVSRKAACFLVQY